jgi:hypothetical protein
MATEYKISPLKGKDDYANWLIDIRAILRRNNLWRYTQSDGATAIAEELAKQTTNPPKEADGTTSIQDKATLERRLKREWQNSTEKAADTITLSLHASVKAKLTEEDFNDSCKMITHLKQLFEPSTDTEFFMLMRDLFDTKFHMFTTTEAYLAHIRTINDKITRTKVELTPDKRALLCLTMTLSSHFEPLVQMWSLQHTPPTFEEAAATIHEHNRRNCSKDKVDQGLPHLNMAMNKAFITHCKLCPNAKKPHYPEDCWKAHPEKRPDWAKNKDNNTTKTGAAMTTVVKEYSPYTLHF